MGCVVACTAWNRIGGIEQTGEVIAGLCVCGGECADIIERLVLKGEGRLIASVRAGSRAEEALGGIR